MTGQLIGVISDTHGLLRSEALAALAGVEHILHAGDIGGAEVLAALAEIAPVTAVRGNNDHGPWAQHLPETAVVQLGPHRLYLLHDLGALDLDLAAAGFAGVIAGHSHKPANQIQDGLLYFNPGSAGPRRFKLPIAVGLLHVTAAAISGEILELDL